MLKILLIFYILLIIPIKGKTQTEEHNSFLMFGIKPKIDRGQKVFGTESFSFGLLKELGKDNLMEIEFHSFKLNQKDFQTVKIINTNFGTSFNYYYRFFFNSSRFRPAIGPAAELNYKRMNNISKVSGVWGYKKTSISATFNVNLGFFYSFSENVLLKFFVPFDLLLIGYSIDEALNPAVSPTNRRRGYFDMELLPLKNSLITLGLVI